MEKFSTNKLIGKKIKELRTNSKLIQLQLAEELSIHPKHLSNIENGRKAVTIALLDKLCNLFHEPHFYFFDCTNYDLSEDENKAITTVIRMLKSADNKTRQNIIQIIGILTKK